MREWYCLNPVFMMMEDRITLDQLSTQTDYNLCELYNNEFTEDDIIDSPYLSIDNTCDYYEPHNVEKLLNQNRSVSLFCLNTQGLRAHWDVFNELIDIMNGDSSNGSFDVIGITELYSMERNECNLNSYHPIEFKTRNDTTGSRGGVGMYIKKEYQFHTRNDLSIFIPHILESIFVEIIRNNRSILVGTIYRPNTPPKADLDIFIHSMLELGSLLKRENMEVFLMGDTNIDLLKFKNNTKTDDYLENIFSSGFLPLITKPTRITPHSATLIDHIYTNKQQIDSTSGIVLCDVSDHCGIFTIFNSSHKTKSINKMQTFRSYSPGNTETFIQNLQSTDFTTILNEPCPDKAYSNFMNMYTMAHDKSFPLRTTRITYKYKKHSPWTTKGLIQSAVTRSKLLIKKMKNPTNANIERYLTYTRIYKKIHRLAKRNFYEEQLENAKHDTKETWTILRKAMNKTKNTIPVPEFFTIDNMKVTDKHEIVNAFNGFFAKIGSEISKNVPTTQTPFSDFLPNPHNTSMFLDPLIPQDTIDITSKLKPKTSKGHDNITTKLVKQSIECIATPLTHIIYQSMVTGIVPQDMKIARVIPIFKSGNQYLFNNYRPISILPAFSKILEKVMATKLIKYLESQHLLYEHHHGALMITHTCT